MKNTLVPENAKIKSITADHSVPTSIITNIATFQPTVKIDEMLQEKDKICANGELCAQYANTVLVNTVNTGIEKFVKIEENLIKYKDEFYIHHIGVIESFYKLTTTQAFIWLLRFQSPEKAIIKYCGDSFLQTKEYKDTHGDSGSYLKFLNEVNKEYERVFYAQSLYVGVNDIANTITPPAKEETDPSECSDDCECEDEEDEEEKVYSTGKDDGDDDGCGGDDDDDDDEELNLYLEACVINESTTLFKIVISTFQTTFLFNAYSEVQAGFDLDGFLYVVQDLVTRINPNVDRIIVTSSYYENLIPSRLSFEALDSNNNLILKFNVVRGEISFE